MKKFNEFSEALLVTLNPKSDSVGPVEQCPCQQQDMMSAAAQDVLRNIGGDVVQPDDGVGEAGEIQADGDAVGGENGVELECTGDGLRVKFNGLEIVLPKDVVEMIKNHEGEDYDPNADITSDEETEETEEGESEESEETEENESEETEETEESDEDDDNVFESLKPVTESKKAKKAKSTPPWLKNKGEKDKEDKKECPCKSKAK